MSAQAVVSRADARGGSRVRLADGVELAGEFVGSGYREAPRLVYRSDGQVIRLPELLYVVVEELARCNASAQATRTAQETAAAVSTTLGREITADQIRYLCDHKLAPLGVTSYSDGSAPPVTRATPFLALRMRTKVLSPAFSWHVAGAFAWLFVPPVLVAGLVLAACAQVWALGTQSIGAALAHTFSSPTGILVLVGLALLSTAFHEAGHAAACRYGGVRPGVMGCGIYLVWPAFYTDITATYRLGRGGRLRADLGGVYFNALFAAALTAAFAVTGYLPFLAALLATDLEIIEQLLPTLRFDGYYIIADLVGIPDLFKFIRPIIARAVLRRRDSALLQELKRWPQIVVTAWVLCVVPVLLVELGYLALQFPDMVRADVASVRAVVLTATTSSTPVLAIAAAAAQIILVLLPVAGIGVILGGLLIGVTRGIVRRLHGLVSPVSLRGRMSTTVVLAAAAAMVVFMSQPLGSLAPPPPRAATCAPSSGTAVSTLLRLIDAQPGAGIPVVAAACLPQPSAPAPESALGSPGPASTAPGTGVATPPATERGGGGGSGRPGAASPAPGSAPTTAPVATTGSAAPAPSATRRQESPAPASTPAASTPAASAPTVPAPVASAPSTPPTEPAGRTPVVPAVPTMPSTPTVVPTTPPVPGGIDVTVSVPVLPALLGAIGLG